MASQATVPSAVLRFLAAVGAACALAASTASSVRAAPGGLDGTFAGFGELGALVTTLPLGWMLNDFAFAPDGRIVAAGSSEHSILVMVFGTDGRPDLSFDGDGRNTLALEGVDVRANGMALQEDGKIVVAGWVDPAASDFLVGRITAAGELDPTFGDGGFVRTDFRGAADVAEEVVVQPDGKIVVAGTASVSGDDDLAVARYTADGTLDASFAGGGKATFGLGGEDEANDVALQPDGRIVLAGTKGGAFDDDLAVLRLNPDGSKDKSFGGDGVANTGFGGIVEAAHAVAIQPDGKIIAAGGGIDDVLVARYHPDGRLDDSFDGDGKRSFGANGGDVKDMAVQADGKIALVGYAKVDTDYQLAVYRLDAGGAWDSAFDGDGWLILDLPGGNFSRAVALQPDGRIVVVGSDGTGNQAVLRLWPDGSPDRGGQQSLAYDEAGFPPGSAETAHGMAVQPDGKIVVAGEVANAARTETDATLTRFLPDGRPDPSFGRHGRLTFGFGTHNSANAVVLQPDGRIVAAGYFRSGQTVNFMVARFLPDGGVDNTFAVVGQNIVDFAGGVDYGWAVALAPDGKIVVAGEAHNGARTVFGVARFLDTGVLDPSFDADGKALVEFDIHLTHWATSVVALPDGRVVVGGQVGTNFAIVGLQVNGKVDFPFGGAGWTIAEMGGPAKLNALASMPGGGFIAAGVRAIGNDSDFALALFGSNGRLSACPPRSLCTTWSDGKAFINWGLTDYAVAVDVRSNGTIAVAGCSGRQFAFAQTSPAVRDFAKRLMATTDFVGSSECAAGVRYAGPDRVVLAGHHAFEGDRNLALARFETQFLAPASTPTPAATATAMATSTATASATATQTSTPTASAMPTATERPTPTATAAATVTLMPTATAQATRTPTESAPASPTARPTGSPSAPSEPTASPRPVDTRTPIAVDTPAGGATALALSRVLLPYVARQ